MLQATEGLVYLHEEVHILHNDINLYCGARRSGPISEHGLCYDVVMNLIQMYPHQGYFLFMDNFYTSPTLVKDLKDRDIWSTGTLRINRKDIPESVLQLHKAMKRSDVPRGTGYYVRDGQEVYTCWKDSGCVTLLSNSYPGHKDGTTMRRAKKRSGEFERLEVPLPSAVRAYNSFMGGPDKLPQNYQKDKEVLEDTVLPFARNLCYKCYNTVQLDEFEGRTEEEK